MTVEKRYLSEAVSLRAATTTGPGKLGGHALKFDRLSQNMGGFVERIAPGAVTKTLRDGGDVLCRYQHEDNYLLGRTSAGTLRLAVDEVGLAYEVDLPDTSYARDLAALAGRDDVRESSFAFLTIADEWGFTDQGFPLRTLLEIHLLDVAPVVSPAYLDTSAGLRSLAEARHFDFDSVRAAAESGQLAGLLRGDQAGPGETHPTAIKRHILAGVLSRRPI